MKEIKFRAWDKRDERMIVDNQKFIPVKVTSMGVLRLNPHHKENFWEFMPEDRFELMQYTGLKDKNGVEIYEGDIIYMNDINSFGKDKKLKYVIEFVNYSFMAILNESKYDDIYPKSINNQPNIEVIGNIHENPELLKL